jgi:hypothetical protein
MSDMQYSMIAGELGMLKSAALHMQDAGANEVVRNAGRDRAEYLHTLIEVLRAGETF